mmetsp:Transcript_54920/g.116695  ORF Transcript_54920/g.116695 Transcript_54920/m.116695 type:complete len:209 (+) Transcript_54920:181-807(+)
MTKPSSFFPWLTASDVLRQSKRGVGRTNPVLPVPPGLHHVGAKLRVYDTQIRLNLGQPRLLPRDAVETVPQCVGVAVDHPSQRGGGRAARVRSQSGRLSVHLILRKLLHHRPVDARQTGVHGAALLAASGGEELMPPEEGGYGDQTVVQVRIDGPRRRRLTDEVPVEARVGEDGPGVDRLDHGHGLVGIFWHACASSAACCAASGGDR